MGFSTKKAARFTCRLEEDSKLSELLTDLVKLSHPLMAVQ